MSRFHQLLNRAQREIITEQDQPPIPPTEAAPSAPETPAPEQAAPTPIPDAPENEEPKEILSPEGMVFLVRLLPKALMIDTLDTTEEAMLADIGASPIFLVRMEVTDNGVRVKRLLKILNDCLEQMKHLMKFLF